LNLVPPILDDKVVPNFYDNFLNCLLIRKTHSTNLEHCFTASMTAHSIRILSEFKMSSFGSYVGEKTRFIAVSNSERIFKIG